MYTSTTTCPISDEIQMAIVRATSKDAESNESCDHCPIIDLKDSSK